jgi:hypothetical protein
MLLTEKDHSHHHHHDHGAHAPHRAHDHAAPAARKHAPSRFRSLIAMSGMQRLLLALPAIAILWLMTFWAMGWLA